MPIDSILTALQGGLIVSCQAPATSPLHQPEIIAAMAEAAVFAARYPLHPPRHEHWGGFRIVPSEIEFWKDGDFRLHDRFRWSRDSAGAWKAQRLNP